jgi:hypothetical protein
MPLLKFARIQRKMRQHSGPLLVVPAIREQHPAYVPQDRADAVHAAPGAMSSCDQFALKS